MLEETGKRVCTVWMSVGLFLCLCVSVFYCMFTGAFLRCVADCKHTGSMHRFGSLSLSLSLPSPALHSTLNSMAMSLSFTQIDTNPHTHRHSPCFGLQEYIGVKPNCLSDMMGASAKTRSGLSGSFVNSMFFFFKVFFTSSFCLLSLVLPFNFRELS